ncbi:lysM and putative peptidoglycan-binding domain-containing protein 3 [Tribolium castaneum]|uniref:LysM and putative peptidoglycan-binding domain-containing protein 3-like Protein n=1 Tax=Tribolium castaneum TaxID=7070 RepID=D6WRZ7_TRICA|nr:PREDICTED: lysM and putative peptidoglycan-binding domain-containing protein 3 [Tribolium castaneum]EFA06411.1 LysM and putative peptidoglycan-binding domain-containing protein 3-like Protein [Tribolium castaneum]|eukprot:XP_976228.2 PREDICTED: lysM and putative peptidoglycan-binding domain-containing protein 3 [Tribolium castaneum]
MMKQRQKLKPDASYKKFGKHSDSDDETELFTVRKTSPKKEKATVEKTVEEGDTLQSLAIRYCCTIEDLKRLNNIHKENEIFAKRTIKVPQYPIALALAGVHVSGRSSPNDPSASGQVDTDQLTTSLKETEVNQIIFNSSLAQKSHDVTEESGDDEEVHLLPHSPLEEPAVTKIDCSGVDGDISIKALVLCIVIVIFAVPLIYVFYVAEHPKQHHHNHVS